LNTVHDVIVVLLGMKFDEESDEIMTDILFCCRVLLLPGGLLCVCGCVTFLPRVLVVVVYPKN
jgi:hypothetical protein